VLVGEKVHHSLAANYDVSFRSGGDAAARHNYPGYNQHKAAHEKLVGQVKQLKQELQAGKAITQEVLQFLQHWLVDHIIGMDQKYFRYLQAAGVK
jgi:hemerythrin-like metal-binding protein